MALTERQQSELLRRYLRRIDTLSLAGGEVVANAFRRIRDLDEAGITELRRVALPTVQAINQEAAATSAGYFGLVLDEPVIAPDVDVEPDWRGPFTRSWAAFGRGEGLEAAVESGAARADAAGRDAVMSTSRRVGDELESDQIRGWHRVPGPGSCEWCVTIAGRTYRTATTADFGHANCNCGVTPITR